MSKSITITEEQAFALENIQVVVPFMRAMIERLKAEHPGKIQLAVISKKPDGSGQVGPAWDSEEFLADLDQLSKIIVPE